MSAPIHLTTLENTREGTKLEAFTFAHCERCNLFFPNVAGQHLVHVCRAAKGRLIPLSTQLAYLVKPRSP